MSIIRLDYPHYSSDMFNSIKKQHQSHPILSIDDIVIIKQLGASLFQIIELVNFRIDVIQLFFGF